MQASDPTLLSQHGYRQLLRDDIQALYTLWKQQLRADQLKEAERTKMYRYRGSAEDEEAEDDEELNRLFPTYDTDAPARNQSHAALIPPFNVSSIGHQLHQAIATLFSRANAAQLLQTLFATALEKIGSLAATIKPSSRESDPAPYLAGVLLLLAKQETSINSSCNFYIDANVPEVKRLASLVRSIRTRFLDLHQSWPNHAAITDVLDCCAAIFEFRHGEPLAKFITKTEQLHGLMHQWQLVASSQYSAAELFNELTSLLISWRRLELTTWSQLFDSETSQCERDASAWWFIAYETVVEAPLKLAQEDQSLQDHCYHLVEVLSQFLSSTPHGQYAARLHLLEQLSQLLGLYSVDQPSLQCVRSALDNVRSHYEAFVPTISRALAEGRTSLEKQVQEVIKLASWKDTNIVALRDSAKRSHHKLFKYVRKYRELLAQSCEPILASGSSADSDRPSSSHAQDLNVMDLKPALPQWNKICDASVIGDRPSRFQDPSATADNMLAVYSAAVDTLDVSQDVSAFVTEVLDTVTSLRAKTPKVLTEENHAEVQHLKVLKKRFFADTLKAIRAMGVRPNLTTDVLGKQASLAAILASTPAIHSMNGVSFKLDDAYFHRLIDLLPKIRVCSRDYAEDLSNVEVARSVGSLEGLLHWVMQQRVTIAVHVTQVQSLSASVEQIVQLCNCSAEALCHDTEKTRSIDTIRGSLQWLRTVLAMADAVVHIYARYNGESGDAVLGAIAVMMEDLSGHIQQLDGLAVLPPGVSVQSREASCDAAVECIARARTTLNDMITLHPSCAFVLRGILPHLSLQFCPVSPRQCSTTAGAHLLEKAATGVADKMLVCLQRISRLPGSASDDSPAWLKKSDQLLIRSLAELHMQDISRELRGTLDHLSVLAQDCSSLPVASAIVASLAPITQRYHFICVDILRRYTGFNRELSKMAYLLGKSFIQIASDGFCSPEQNSEEQGKAGKLESGTGLGEGEGAEDISKDVQDDEDLSDLAQDKQKMDDKEGPDEDNEEAVNMDQEDLEADASDFEKEDNHDKSEEPSDDEDEQDIDEESGSVDPLDADAVDEKMWDGAQDEEQHNVETDREQGTTQSGDATAAADEDHSPAEQQPDEPRADDQDSDGPDNEDEAVGPPDDAEMTDPHAKEEQVLDLPEDMDLDGLDHEKETSDSEDGLDDLSDVDPLDQSAPEMQKEDQEQAITPDEVKASDDPGQEEDKPMDDEEEGHSADVEVEDEDEQQPVNQNEDILQAESEDRSADQEQVAPSDAVTSGIDFDEHAQDQRGTAGDAQQAEQATDDSENIQPQSEEAAEGVEKGEASKEGGGRDDESADRQPEQAFQKLGDILEKWHRRQQEIQQAQDEEAGARQQREDLDLQEVDFEHLADDNDVADTQALGQASEEQAKGLDDRQAIESEEQPHDENILPLPDEPEQDPDTVPSTDPMDVESKADAAEERRAGAIIAGTGNTHDSQVGDIARTDEFSDLEDVDASLSALHMSCAELVPIDEARRLWSHHESVTHDLALSLTEQLRLILAPTMATKLRGDYRTGKRLNIKRIIPYIASQFKRDKIWMRRSVPSKRNYQIMLAVDDSKSMQESGSSQLAYETLALVARSLSMLEVGDLCVVGFGNEDHVRIAHEFGKTFSSEAGVHIFQQFSFQQTGTNVRQLIADSLALFRDAKNQQSRGSGNADLWQLQLIISDGICEDHDTIRRLVRQAQDERVMIVFIIVDATKGSSILDLTQARFEPDASGTGEMKLKMTRYLEGFPFAYYLVVRDVQELPAVLSLALKQWFAEVVDNAA
ncbi:hypothetical protein KEM52_006312 [Ascosphaera acerosa]|nr:hypothetical protein KEM52_006312 [Ascosphaera acerosa]